ncbi:WYL domain-containing protein [Microbacterium sp. 10M-3C3]|jgi:biotin operon repressor|uniref:helix-turn-helix transcriptional regulator n=1 Tax=Microbacterium sp. 10M-3C3 TaxID=2483401 RepID=UPI003204C166
MPASTAPGASRRLLALLTLLQTPREWPAPALAERLGVSERTIRRDVERLRELDYAIESTRGPIGGYRLTAGADLPPLLFDDGQAVAVALALRTAAARGAQLEDDAARALVTVERMLPSRLAHRVDALRAVTAAASEVAVDPAVLVRIGEAVRARRELRFGYLPAGRDDEPPGAPLRTQPHHVLLHDGRWYVIGWTPEREAWRTYRVDRMVLRSHDGAEFTPRVVPGGDPAAFLAAQFKGSEGGVDAWPVRHGDDPRAGARGRTLHRRRRARAGRARSSARDARRVVVGRARRPVRALRRAPVRHRADRAARRLRHRRATPLRCEGVSGENGRMPSDILTQLVRRLSSHDLLTDLAVDGDVVRGRAWLEGLDTEVALTVDPEIEDVDDPDVDALVAATEAVLNAGAQRWVEIVDDVATEIEEAVEQQGGAKETTDLRTELTLTSLTVFAEASLVRFTAARQFPSAQILVQLDEELEISDLSVVEDD